MKWLLFLYWRFVTPVNIRVSLRALRNPTGIARFDSIMLRECFNRCSPLEQEWLQRQNGVYVITKPFFGEP